MTRQTINNYIIERKLGEGGMGDVYFARHNRIDRVVAIKILHQNLFANESIRNRFKNEANALIKLIHANIVKIYDYIEQDDLACLIIEYIEGYTLDDYILKISGPLSARKAIHIICEVLDAVQYAHDHNIYHRDIKPGNIMLSRDGKMVKIMDFGIAKFTDSSKLKTTHANTQLGTPFYMSPEQVKGLRYTTSSDIYSLGVTLFEMVTGKCPYLEITNLFELQSKIVNEPLPPTSKYYPDVSLKIQEAIKIATNKVPEQRFKNCNEFKAYLLQDEKVRPVTVLKQTQLEQPKPQQPNQEKTVPQLAKPQQFIEEKKKGNNWVYLMLLLSLLILGAIIYVVAHKTDVPKDRLTIDDTTSRSISTIQVTNDSTIPKLKGDSFIGSREADMNELINAPPIKVVKTEEFIKKPSQGKKELPPMENKEPTIKSLDKGTDKNDRPTQTITHEHNVKNDLEKYLAERKTFCGIQYNDISEIEIIKVDEGKSYEDNGNTSYDVNITINGINRKCQVVYIRNSDKPKVNCL